MTENQHLTIQTQESAEKRPNTLSTPPASLRETTYYAIINIEATGLSNPIVITNKMATTDPRSVGPEPAIFSNKEKANEQLTRQKVAFGTEHLRLIQFTINEVFGQGELTVEE